MSDEKQIQDRLAEPFTNVQWRLQQTTPKDAKVNGRYQAGTKGLFMAYIDARQLYDRLDDVLGLGNWQRIVKSVNSDGSVIVALSIRIDGEWITHEDIGYPNNPGASYETEPLKAAVSDGAKRAAVGLGVGRFLYELDPKWVEIDEWGKPKRNIGVTVHQAAPSSDAPVSEPEAPQPDLPPRARTTTQNTVHAMEPSPASDVPTGWTQFWNAAREVGLKTKPEAEKAIGQLGSSPDYALERLAAWKHDNAHQKAMVS